MADCQVERSPGKVFGPMVERQRIDLRLVTYGGKLAQASPVRDRRQTSYGANPWIRRGQT